MTTIRPEDYQMVQDYFDGILPDSKTEQVKVLLTQYPEIAEQFAEYEQIKGIMKKEVADKGDTRFEQVLRSRIQRGKAELKNPIYKYFEIWSLILLILLGVMVVISFLILQQNQESQPEGIPAEKAPAGIILPDSK